MSSFMENKLVSRTAVVTGAAQGIGAAIAKLFVQQGCFVYVTDINDDLGNAVAGNSIHPAVILTPMWEPMLGSDAGREERMAALVQDTSLRRFGMPEEVAALALLLASDDATYITCSEFNIEGGLLAGTAAIPAVLNDS